jgi:pimeloyl-ACP methyl ester carboxylesterase
MTVEQISDKTMTLKDGRTVGYAEYGAATGAPVILFHGMPGSRRSGAIFDEVAQAHGAHIVVADRPGYALSSPVPRGSLSKYVEDVAALADTLHFDRFAVLGVSGGGPFALACAAKIPERVNCCGLMSTIGPLALPHALEGMASINRFVFSLARFWPALPGALLPGQIRSSMKSSQKYIDEGKSPAADVSPAVFARLAMDQLEAVRAGGKGITFDMRILTHDWGFALESIRTPVYMWHGADDNLAPAALARYVAEHIPGCTFKLVPNAGHAGTLACADEVMAALLNPV